MLKGKKILVVDDVKINFILIKGLLKSSGANVLWAEDGFEAIASFRANRPDLILMDYHMPGLNGYQAAIKIKNEEINLPIICQTTDSIAVQREDQKRVFNDFILKPLNKNNLLKKISENIV